VWNWPSAYEGDNPIESLTPAHPSESHFTPFALIHHPTRGPQNVLAEKTHLFAFRLGEGE
jgi:hypothetical protein